MSQGKTSGSHPNEQGQQPEGDAAMRTCQCNDSEMDAKEEGLVGSKRASDDGDDGAR